MLNGDREWVKWVRNWKTQQNTALQQPVKRGAWGQFTSFKNRESSMWPTWKWSDELKTMQLCLRQDSLNNIFILSLINGARAVDYSFKGWNYKTAGGCQDFLTPAHGYFQVTDVNELCSVLVITYSLVLGYNSSKKLETIRINKFKGRIWAKPTNMRGHGEGLYVETALIVLFGVAQCHHLFCLQHENSQQSFPITNNQPKATQKETGK